MKTMKHRMIVMVMAAAMVLPAMAQWSGTEHTTATAPTASFQSTSMMPSSGSTYSSTPLLGDDGTAIYDDGGSASAHAHGNPRRVGPPTPEGDPTPVGDAALPLLLMALLYVVYRRRVI